jgi:serine/threonine protein kinase
MTDNEPDNPFLAALEMDRKCINITEEIGRGQFGVVFRAQATLNDSTAPIAVAVKALPPDATAEQQKSLQYEANRMCRLHHFNVLSLLGVCLRATPYLLVVELMDNGDLKSYLRYCRTAHTGLVGESALLKLSRDVCAGCEYLASVKFVHRDIAARNVLLGSQYVAKISDFGACHVCLCFLDLICAGMSRSLYTSDV